MNEQKLAKIMQSIKKDLSSALLAYSMNNKDKDIKTAIGKIDVLMELIEK